jgi:hypothetical protein
MDKAGRPEKSEPPGAGPAPETWIFPLPTSILAVSSESDTTGSETFFLQEILARFDHEAFHR